MTVGAPTGPGGSGPVPPDGSGSPPPQGGGDAGKPPPAGAEGAPEGGAPPGEDFGTFDGGVDFGEALHMASDAAGDDLQARQLVNTIRMNTVSHEASAGAGAHREMSDSASGHERASADSFTAAGELEARADTRADIGRALSEFRTSGDSRELMSLFSRFSAGERAAAKGPGTGAPTNPGTPVPGKGTLTAPLASRGDASGAPTGTGTGTPTNPPIFPNTTDPRLANLSTRTPTFVPPIAPRDPSKPPTPEQELETQLRAALSGSPPDEAAAQAALDGLAALGVELGPEQETDEVGDRADVEASEGEGEGEGDAGRMPGSAGGEGGDRRARAPRAVTFSTEHLSEGLTVLSGGGRGDDAEVDAHGARMERGLALVTGGGATGYATHVATDGAVRGTYAEDDGSGGGSGADGSSGDGSVAFGDMVDTDGALAAGGYRLDTAAAGLGGSYGVRTPDGRFIPQWLALSEHGGLPPGVRSAIGRDASLRTRFGAEALSGHRAGLTGDLFAGARC